MRTIKIIILYTLCCFPSLAQEYSFDHLTVEDGLPSNRVYFTYHDSKGFIWFCTDMGVCRYNGQEFENFTTEDGLADNDVFNCFEDKWGRIWFATNNGELSFLKMKNSIIERIVRGLDNYKRGSMGRFFVQNDKKKSFHFLRSEGNNSYFEVDSNSIRTIETTNPNLLYTHKNNYLYYAKDNEVIYTGYETINQIQTSFLYNAQKKIAERLSYKANWIILSKSNSAFIRIKDSLYSCANNKMLPFKLSGQKLYSYWKNKDEMIFGFENGLEFQNKLGSSFYLKDKHPTGLAFDSFKNLFISTYTNGVFIRKKTN